VSTGGETTITGSADPGATIQAAIGTSAGFVDYVADTNANDISQFSMSFGPGDWSGAETISLRQIEGSQESPAVVATIQIAAPPAGAPIASATMPTAELDPSDPTSVDISWGDIFTADGSRITGYRVGAYTGPTPAADDPRLDAVTGTNAVLSGLAPGVPVDIIVYALSAVGATASASATITPPPLTPDQIAESKLAALAAAESAAPAYTDVENLPAPISTDPDLAAGTDVGADGWAGVAASSTGDIFYASSTDPTPQPYVIGVSVSGITDLGALVSELPGQTLAAPTIDVVGPDVVAPVGYPATTDTFVLPPITGEAAPGSNVTLDFSEDPTQSITLQTDAAGIWSTADIDTADRWDNPTAGFYDGGGAVTISATASISGSVSTSSADATVLNSDYDAAPTVVVAEDEITITNAGGEPVALRDEQTGVVIDRIATTDDATPTIISVPLRFLAGGANMIDIEFEDGQSYGLVTTVDYSN
jgi:hypothetical protein